VTTNGWTQPRTEQTETLIQYHTVTDRRPLSSSMQLQRPAAVRVATRAHRAQLLSAVATTVLF